MDDAKVTIKLLLTKQFVNFLEPIGQNCCFFELTQLFCPQTQLIPSLSSQFPIRAKDYQNQQNGNDFSGTQTSGCWVAENLAANPKIMTRTKMASVAMIISINLFEKSISKNSPMLTHQGTELY